MRLSHCVGVLVLTAFASFAAATPDQTATRALATATANLEKGNELLAGLPKLHTNAARLQTLDRALYFLRRARTLVAGREVQFDKVRADAADALVVALDDEADIYYQRKSLTLAAKRADEAIAIDVRDSRARNLAAMIAAAKSTDIYADNVGTVAIDRIRARRAAAGIPLRDRGIGSRR